MFVVHPWDKAGRAACWALNCDNCPRESTEQCVVALTWILKDTLGEELDVLDDPVEFLVGGDDLLARIEEALQGHGVGAELALHLEPEDAFGDYQDKLLFLELGRLEEHTSELQKPSDASAG